MDGLPAGLIGSLLIGAHPEKIENVGRDHGVAEEKRGWPGRQELIDPPTDERCRQQQASQKYAARRAHTDLKQPIPEPGEEEWRGAKPSVQFRRDELIRQQEDARRNQGKPCEKRNDQDVFHP
jgi:hypothetical protein